MSLVMILLAVLFVASTGNAAEKFVPKVDNIIFFVDYSGSMALDSTACDGKKIDMAKEAATAIANSTPELDYNAGVYTFAPFSEVAGMSTFSKATVTSAVARIDSKYPVTGRMTPMGPGLLALDPVLGKLSGRTAVVMFTDGNANQGSDPVTEAQALYAKYDICIHVVSVADNDEGQNVIDAIRALNNCSCTLGGNVCEPSGYAEFADCAFYDTAAEEVVVVEDPDVIRLRGVHFNFDKSDIRDEDTPVLEAAAEILKENQNINVIVEGHTDFIGSDQYNQGLSERRANSVKDWLIKNGINASRMSTVGYGEANPVADNDTSEGRLLNRRVQFRVE